MPYTPIEFRFSGAKRAPRRAASGETIRSPIIRAMSEQQQAFAEAHRLADKLVDIVRRVDSSPPPGRRGH